jgi:uncharacterized protein (TIGR02996 family)
LLEALELKLAPTQRLTEGLLAAVQSSPGEDSPRLVFADALTEQGDARGEFIALQFAHALGELPMGKREHLQRLLAASGRAWFDGLDSQVAPLAVFHKGFLNEVRLATRTPEPASRAWTTVESLDAAGIATTLASFLAHPNLAGLHTLRSLRGGTLEELARQGEARKFQLIEVSRLGGRDIALPKWTVDRLRLLAPIDEAVWWFSGSSLRSHVGTLALQATGGFDRIGPAVTQLEEKAPALSTIEFAAKAPPWPLLWHGDWLLRFQRDARGKFSRLQISVGDELLTGLEAALAGLERDQVKSIQVQTVLRRGPVWREQTRASIERALSAQRRLEESSFELQKPILLPLRGVVHEGR